MERLGRVTVAGNTSLHMAERDPVTVAFDPSSYTVSIGDRVVRLTVLKLELLRVLLQHAPRVVSHDDLPTAVWGAHASDKRN